ncbi:MAG TPA: glycosyltransferase [Roseateles sp.]|nr:glycosyltransferase [Roseateles sp.]HWT54253.1 glycosyltransferase [Rhodocyclaceae bacterium]
MYINYLRRKAVFRLKQKISQVHRFNEIPDDANTLLVTARHELAETQIYPFYFYRAALRERGVEHVELPIASLVEEMADPLQARPQPNPNIRRVFVQHGFMMPDQAVEEILDTLAAAFPFARIAFMDWFAPLHIRYASCSAPYIDLYIKKQLYRDYREFSKPTLGDTNLNDYYARRFSLDDPAMQYSPPPGFEEKLRLGSNFCLSPQMVDYFLGAPPPADGRDIDLHARIAVNGVPWYQAMREEARNAVGRLRGIRIAAEGRVRRHKFFAEMQRSKLCFSPFGYGEVCWRDYEAFATGALLLKPDVEHLAVVPEAFESEQTYVPLRWDLADLEDKVDYYLKHEDERKAICRNAFERIKASIVGEQMPRELAALSLGRDVAHGAAV